MKRYIKVKKLKEKNIKYPITEEKIYTDELQDDGSDDNYIKEFLEKK